MHARVLLNAGTLRGLGSGSIGSSIVAALATQPHLDLVARIPREWGYPGELDRGNGHVSWVGAGTLNKFYNDQIASRYSARKHGCDAAFSLGDTSTVACSLPHLLLVQQCYLATDPADYDFDLPRAWKLRLALMRANLRACLPSVDLLTVQTNAMKDAMCHLWRLDPDRIVVIPSGVVDTGPVTPRWGEVTATGHPYIIYPAAPYPHKNHDLLPPIMARLAATHPHLRCVVTVAPHSVPSMVEAAKRLGVGDRFEFVGPRDLATTRALMARSRAIVFPSKLESFGIPCYEALELGVPLVVADRPYSREACGDAAFYCDADDHHQFAEALDALLGDENVATQLSARALQRAEAAVVPWLTIGRWYAEALQALGTK